MVSLMTAAPRTGGAADATPLKSSGRRSTLVRKRDDTDFDIHRDSTPSSPSKKAKVTFDNEVEVRVMDEWEKAPAVVREEVRRALERHVLGDDTGYDRVKEIYRRRTSAEDAPSTATLRNYTAALLSSVSALNRSCSGLVSRVLQSDWTGMPDEYIALYLRFLGNLVSAQGTYLGDVLRMLVGCLAYSESIASMLSSSMKLTLQ